MFCWFVNKTQLLLLLRITSFPFNYFPPTTQEYMYIMSYVIKTQNTDRCTNKYLFNIHTSCMGGKGKQKPYFSYVFISYLRYVQFNKLSGDVINIPRV